MVIAAFKGEGTIIMQVRPQAQPAAAAPARAPAQPTRAAPVKTAEERELEELEAEMAS